MNRAWKILGILGLVPILTTSGMMAADTLYGAWAPSNSSRNIPAGTVVDPGSELLYIVDTGSSLRRISPPLLEITGASSEV